MRKHAYILYAGLMWLAVVATAQAEPVKCSTKIVAKTDLNLSLNALTAEKLQPFFDTFDADCRSNTDYSKFSNQVLFRVAAEQPELFLTVLAENSEKRPLILDALAHPVDNKIEIRALQDKINQAKGPANAKAAVIRSLTSARQRL